MIGWQPVQRRSEEWLVERLGTTFRLTEDGKLRITEDSVGYRVIERVDLPQWSKHAAPSTTWAQE